MSLIGKTITYAKTFGEYGDDDLYSFIKTSDGMIFVMMMFGSDDPEENVMNYKPITIQEYDELTIKSIGKECTTEVPMDLASKGGHLEVVKYLHSIGKECSFYYRGETEWITDAMNLASRGGHLEVVKYLHSIGKKCTTKTMELASTSGNVEVVKFLYSIGIKFTTDALSSLVDAENHCLYEAVEFLLPIVNSQSL